MTLGRGKFAKTEESLGGSSVAGAVEGSVAVGGEVVDVVEGLLDDLEVLEALHLGVPLLLDLLVPPVDLDVVLLEQGPVLIVVYLVQDLDDDVLLLGVALDLLGQVPLGVRLELQHALEVLEHAPLELVLLEILAQDLRVLLDLLVLQLANVLHQLLLPDFVRLGHGVELGLRSDGLRYRALHRLRYLGAKSLLDLTGGGLVAGRQGIQQLDVYVDVDLAAGVVVRSEVQHRLHHLVPHLVRVLPQVELMVPDWRFRVREHQLQDRELGLELVLVGVEVHGGLHLEDVVDFSVVRIGVHLARLRLQLPPSTLPNDAHALLLVNLTYEGCFYFEGDINLLLDNGHFL
eukprot:CAMPEP_0168621234 /NCGR_PEP_ID=MMETSP0449_2-20121227/7577_1 /TAXON_ID=1082188 /ORGANISM="Strombidium rassoulzadegani, Strain ras09" /LENGTH=345 /DNA_ID=CAMNT_0008662323 /DNA_START=29 /DNA_END=1062 /DNA_ORIENTATION=-